MIKQLGFPKLFKIINCIDLRSNGVISFVAALRGKPLVDEETPKKKTFLLYFLILI